MTQLPPVTPPSSLLVAAPEWLVKAWASARRRGVDAMTLDEINAEIEAHRDEQKTVQQEAK